MVVDMSVDAWNYTLDANLISNYVLMHHVVPLMSSRARLCAHVLVYFGGEKYLAVAYRTVPTMPFP
jgi:malonyl-CoA reductase/3-hydroxypropionate dehydrogenase (NADP+)